MVDDGDVRIVNWMDISLRHNTATLTGLWFDIFRSIRSCVRTAWRTPSLIRLSIFVEALFASGSKETIYARERTKQG